jgi:hypothetical protein
LLEIFLKRPCFSETFGSFLALFGRFSKLAVDESHKSAQAPGRPENPLFDLWKNMWISVYNSRGFAGPQKTMKGNR